jgi:SNF2 family DNA or RNA helicase
VTAASAATFAPARTLPNGQNLWSEYGLFDFQADAVAEAYLRTEPGEQSGILCVYDTGLGKTFVSMGLAVMLFEDDKIDLVVVVAERNKITDWRDDFTNHTTLKAHRYHGTGRQKRLAKETGLHVFITTYETARNELMTYERTPARRGKHKVDGPLMETLGLRGKRVLIVYDEVTKLRNRSSELHAAHAYALGQLRKGPLPPRVLGLTATPMERDYEDSYNIGRIVCPERMPNVETFERTFVDGRDDYGRARFKRSTETVFASLFQGLIMRKRKTDADVIEQFPQQIEQFVHVEMRPDHAELYEIVEGLFDPPPGKDDPRTDQQKDADDRRLYGLLRLTAGHPGAHIWAQSELSQLIVDAVGVNSLRAIKSSKVEALLPDLKALVKGQGAQTIIFTFFGNAVLKELVRDLRDAGYSVLSYCGSNSLKQNDDAKTAFVKGDIEILVTSDAGSKGLNLQNAQYVFEYESALTFANRTQRINRIHRIGSKHASVTCYTLILDGTIEEGIVNKVLKRNEQQDRLLGDEDDGSAFVSAATRRELLQMARNRRSRR